MTTLQVRADPGDAFWPQWRGPTGTGAAPDANPPLEWSEDHNVRWKIALPGTGHSTPIVWGDRIFVTVAVPVGDPLPPTETHRHGAHDNLAAVRRQQFGVLAIRRSDGHILWQRTVHDQVPHEGGHRTSSFASNSPVTDGERVYALFGSAGLYCLDVGGNPVWDVDLGDMHSKHGHGEGASPALHGDTLVVNWDHEGDSFVVALDKLTGEQRWKVERDEVTSWSTPIVVEHDGKAQVIISASNRIRGYDLKTGEVIWECGGLSHNVVASPVAGGGLVYAGSNYDTRALLAIRLDGARGDITGTDRVAWTRTRDTPYVPSPLLYGERLYFLKVFHGILTCVDAVTGDPVFGPIRLPGVSEVYASPVGAAGRVYITSIAGTTLVINHDGPPEMMAANQLDDRFNASPALADGELYLRGEEYLYCIAEDASARPEERVFEESDGRVTVEAEHFLEQTETGTRAWHLTTTTVTPSFDDDADGPHTEGAGGGAYLEILPDTRQNHSHELIPGENFSNTPGQLAILHYKVRFQQAGRYYVWVRAFSTGSEDNGLHVGIDGEWPDSGQRLQWCDGKHAWRWESKQRTAANHCGEPHKIYVDVTEPGVHTIQFSMREDGFEFDQFILTTNRDFVPPP